MKIAPLARIRKSYKSGTPVKVCEGSGIDSGKEGVIIPWQGPVDQWHTRCVWIRYNDGSIGSMFKNRLMPLRHLQEA